MFVTLQRLACSRSCRLVSFYYSTPIASSVWYSLQTRIHNQVLQKCPLLLGWSGFENKLEKWLTFQTQDEYVSLSMNGDALIMPSSFTKLFAPPFFLRQWIIIVSLCSGAGEKNKLVCETAICYLALCWLLRGLARCSAWKCGETTDCEARNVLWNKRIWSRELSY